MYSTICSHNSVRLIGSQRSSSRPESARASVSRSSTRRDNRTISSRFEVSARLYSSAVRSRRSVISGVRAQIGGVDVEALFAGAQGEFVGLDQVNLSLPGILVGRGEVDVLLTVDGKIANPVKLSIK